MLEYPKVLSTDKVKMKEMITMGNQQESRLFWIGWLSGIIDGEGTIGIMKKENGRYLVPVVAIQNCSKQLVEKCGEVLESLGLPCYVSKNGYKYQGIRKDVYAWRIDGIKRCKKFLDTFLPFIFAKKMQADVVKKFCDYRLSVPPRHPYSDYENRLVALAKELNHRGKAESPTTICQPANNGRYSLNFAENAKNPAEMVGSSR